MNFLFEQIFFIKKQNDGRVDKPLVIADGVEEPQTLMHTICGLVLDKHLVILRQSDNENDGCHILETVNPFLSL